METRIKIETKYHPNDTVYKWELSYDGVFPSRWFRTKELMNEDINEYKLEVNDDKNKS